MNAFTRNDYKKQSGLSLVELMVALLISTILLLGVLELFGSGSQTSRSANALARLQENGRLAMDLISREARRTGFNGCSGAFDNSSVDFGDGIDVDFPNQSMKGSTDKSLSFRYYTFSQLTADNCNGTLDKRYITFRNDGKNNIRVISDETGPGGQTLLNNAEIISVYYLQPCEADPEKTCSSLPGNLPKLADGSPSFKAVQKLQVTLKLCTDTLSERSPQYCNNDTTAIKRTFSSLIELRNRL